MVHLIAKGVSPKLKTRKVKQLLASDNVSQKARLIYAYVAKRLPHWRIRYLPSISLNPDIYPVEGFEELVRHGLATHQLKHSKTTTSHEWTILYPPESTESLF
ncbi:hypothetical protein V6R21_24650 [Limibacter armeniacum]|uniref:hypothetical protein n=1 Tax=Limibacter armeniacum TaxID=466084 RepID=UPI002FE68F33